MLFYNNFVPWLLTSNFNDKISEFQMGAKFIINNIKYFKMNACVGTLVAEAWSTFCDQTGGLFCRGQIWSRVAETYEHHANFDECGWSDRDTYVGIEAIGISSVCLLFRERGVKACVYVSKYLKQPCLTSLLKLKISNWSLGWGLAYLSHIPFMPMTLEFRKIPTETFSQGIFLPH